MTASSGNAALTHIHDLVAQEKPLRALRETGGDPSAATARPPGEVEGYLG